MATSVYLSHRPYMRDVHSHCDITILWFTSSSLKDNNLILAMFNVLPPEVTVFGSQGGFLMS